MDKWQALNTFWNRFDLVAYDENTVPDGAALPYITYMASTGEIDEPIYLTASIWYRSNSWTEVSQKADEISNYIGGGAGESYDGGRLWITKSVPFAQRMSEASDYQVRRILLQVNAEFQ
jgi:hypothetical protein